jgi:hypothetical protein
VIVPTWGFKDQVTAVLVLPVIVVVKVALCPPVSDVAPVDDKVRTSGVSVTVAVAVLVLSATLVAVSVTVCVLLMVAGGV